MYSSILAVTLSAFSVLVASHPSPRSHYAVKDSHFVPNQWSKIASASAEHTINLSIALKQDQFTELERHLYEVSDVNHPRYGQHLSAAEVDALVAPSVETTDLVHEWLAAFGISPERLTYSSARDWIKVSLPVSAVEDLLATKYHVFEHEDGTRLVRTLEYSLPQHLHEHISAIVPTNSFIRARPQSSLAIAASDRYPLTSFPDLPSSPYAAAVCNTSGITPRCLRTLYNTINYTPQVPGKNRIGLTDYLGESNNRSDISLFLKQYRPEATPYAYQFPVVIINNGDDQQTPDTPDQLAVTKDTEGDLDAETIIGITYPTPLTAYTTGGSPPFIPDDQTPQDFNEPYLDWLMYVLAQPSVPQTISTSYSDDEQTVPYSYATTVCAQFAQLGARGVSLLFASGDFGVGPSGNCFSNDGTNRPMFLPAFPASCPYVTAVGGTMNINPEVVANDPSTGFVSGGGFSNYFPTPKYQQAAVSAYVASLGNEFAGLYNRSGRGYPDVSAQGTRFVTVWDGSILLQDGTSASTPTTASVISLVNDALIAQGRPPLGFLNPWLYAGGYAAFNDVTIGSAVGCNTSGFPAEVGWDPVTGFGTPDFLKIRAAVGA